MKVILEIVNYRTLIPMMNLMKNYKGDNNIMEKQRKTEQSEAKNGTPIDILEMPDEIKVGDIIKTSRGKQRVVSVFRTSKDSKE